MLSRHNETETVLLCFKVVINAKVKKKLNLLERIKNNYGSHHFIIIHQKLVKGGGEFKTLPTKPQVTILNSEISGCSI